MKDSTRQFLETLFWLWLGGVIVFCAVGCGGEAAATTIGRQSSPADWEENTNILPITFGFYRELYGGTGGGRRVIRKHILEDSPLNGDD